MSLCYLHQGFNMCSLHVFVAWDRIELSSSVKIHIPNLVVLFASGIMLASLFINLIYLRMHSSHFWYICCCNFNGCRIVEHLMMWNHYYYHCSSERAQRSRQHERGTSAERRYKRSHRRSPTSSNHRRQHRHRHHGGHGSGHTHRGHRDLAEHSRRSYSSSQVSLEKVSEAARTILPRGFLQQHKLCTSATTTANILCPFHWCRKSINVLFLSNSE